MSRAERCLLHYEIVLERAFWKGLERRQVGLLPRQPWKYPPPDMCPGGRACPEAQVHCPQGHQFVPGAVAQTLHPRATGGPASLASRLDTSQIPRPTEIPLPRSLPNVDAMPQTHGSGVTHSSNTITKVWTSFNAFLILV